MLLAGLSASMSILRCDPRAEWLFDGTEAAPGIGTSRKSTPTRTSSFRYWQFNHVSTGTRIRQQPCYPLPCHPERNEGSAFAFESFKVALLPSWRPHIR